MSTGSTTHGIFVLRGCAPDRLYEGTAEALACQPCPVTVASHSLGHGVDFKPMAVTGYCVCNSALGTEGRAWERLHSLLTPLENLYLLSLSLGSVGPGLQCQRRNASHGVRPWSLRKLKALAASSHRTLHADRSEAQKRGVLRAEVPDLSIIRGKAVTTRGQGRIRLGLRQSTEGLARCSPAQF